MSDLGRTYRPRGDAPRRRGIEGGEVDRVHTTAWSDKATTTLGL